MIKGLRNLIREKREKRKLSPIPNQDEEGKKNEVLHSKPIEV